jgi:hypothetical protein
MLSDTSASRRRFLRQSLAFCAAADTLCGATMAGDNDRKSEKARDGLKALLTPMNMPLKEAGDDTIRELEAGEAAKWLGFVVHKGEEGLKVTIVSGKKSPALQAR